jgi:hypothetical protein
MSIVALPSSASFRSYSPRYDEGAVERLQLDDLVGRLSGELHGKRLHLSSVDAVVDDLDVALALHELRLLVLLAVLLEVLRLLECLPDTPIGWSSFGETDRMCHRSSREFTLLELW